MRIGIFGGTFDPIHLAHLIIAEQSREQAQLDQVRFVPSFQPPHKADTRVTLFDRRVEMLRLALAGRTDFVVDLIEQERPGPSYTADTLAEMHSRFPNAQISLIVGSDCLPDLPGWYQPQRIVAQASLLVVARPSAEIWSREHLAEALTLQEPEMLRLQIIESPLISFASTDLRQRVAQGRSIRYLVPRAVEEYIREKGLYRDGSVTSSPTP